jgi:hypothetical protein
MLRFLAIVVVVLWSSYEILHSVDAAAAEKEYLYLAEEDHHPESVYPIREYYPTKDDPQANKPDFVYNPIYPYPRIVVYYAHWCSHCQHFKPEYIKFGKSMESMLKEINQQQQQQQQQQPPSSSSSSTPPPPIVMEYHAVSCVPHHAICVQQGITGYPHIMSYQAESINGTRVKMINLHPMAMLRLFGISATGGSERAAADVPVLPNNAGNNKNLLQRLGLVNPSPLPPPPIQQQQQLLQNQIPTFFGDRSKMELYQDAHLSFDFALRTAIYTTDGPLGPRPRTALRNFLVLVQRTLPPMATLQPVVAALLDQFETAVVTGVGNLTKLMDDYPMPQNHEQRQPQWSPACMQHGTGYTCGLWILFHIMSVGFVEWNEMVTTPDWTGLKPTKTADTIRGFVEHFFQCEGESIFRCRLEE